MTLKRFIAAIIACLMMTGCGGLTFSVGELLNAPSIASEQAAILDALTRSAGKSVTLCYPRSGDYRSAFIITDMDADGNDEALAFYTPAATGNEQQNVRVSVLDRDADGSWNSTYELSGRGVGIDSVMIADYGKVMDIVIGYETQSLHENNVNIYRYSDGILSSLYDGSYTVLDRFDIDGCGKEEMAIISKTGNDVSVSVIKTGDGLHYDIFKRTLSTDAVSISGSCIGGLANGINAMFIDLVNENSQTVSEVIYLENGNIVSPTSDKGLAPLTARHPGYNSLDYDGDGIVEIPIISHFPGYPLQSSEKPGYMTGWLSYDADLGIFTVEASSYFDPAMGCIFRLPGRWQNLVSVLPAGASNEVTFVRYDYGEGELSGMQQLLTICAIYPEEQSEYIAAGYSYIGGSDYISFMAKDLAPAREPFALTSDEIRSNLYYIES